MVDLPTIPCLLALAVAAIIAWKAVLFYRKKAPRRNTFKGMSDVEPVADSFDWQVEGAYKHRPFKKVYHVTMNLSRTTRTEWLKVEDTYERNVNAHVRIMKDHASTTCMALDTPETTDAVREMYDYVLDTLSKRYPKYYTVDGDVVVNKLRQTKLPLNSRDHSPRELLQTLGKNMEEDVFILQYDESVKEYRLMATTGLAGLGFEWRQKVGLKLTDIHGPVPQYKERLQMSMNRYFNKITPDQFAQRVTFGLALSKVDDLYSAGNLSFNNRGGNIDLDNLDFENSAFIRLERQVLTRLPKSKFLGFTIRTYMYSLADIKREGMGDLCADAFEAWPEDTATYKGRHIWGYKIIPYLRSGIDSKAGSEKKSNARDEPLLHVGSDVPQAIETY